MQDLINCGLSQIPIRYQVLYSVADVASFQAFFNYSDMRMLLENFSVYHVNAPGQEEAAQPLPDELVFALLILSYNMGNVQRLFWNRSSKQTDMFSGSAIITHLYNRALVVPFPQTKE